MTEPQITSPKTLQNPQGGLLLRAGALEQISQAMSLQVLYSGLISDELSALNSNDAPEDQRLPLQQSNFPWPNLSLGRNSAITAIQVLRQYDPTPRWHIGEQYALIGFIEIALAEDMCSGVPLASVSLDSVTPGPGLTRDALLSRALSDLDSASIYASTGGDSIADFARLGRARALLDKNQLAAAANVADSVNPAFAYTLQFDGSVSPNQVWQQLTNLAISVSDNEGINGLPYRSAGDPRVIITNDGVDPATNDTAYGVASYGSGGAPIIIASGVESRLVIAEAQLPANGGAGTSWLDTLNALRTNGTFSVQSTDTSYAAGEGGVSGLHPLSDPGTDSARLRLVFTERAMWLFLTGHRQGDMRRLVRFYGVPESAVFPTGPYHLGGNYGTVVDFLVYGEGTNPLYKGCVDSGP